MTPRTVLNSDEIHVATPPLNSSNTQCNPTTSQARGVAQHIMELTRLLNRHHRSPREHWKVVRTSKHLLKEATIEEIFNDNDPRPHVNVEINTGQVRGLLDSGATISCIGKNASDTLHRCNLEWKEYGNVIQTASGQKQEVKGYVDAKIKYNNKSKHIRLYIVPTLSQELYLGIDFWLAFDLLPKLEEIAIIPEVSSNTHKLDPEMSEQLAGVIKAFPSCEAQGLGKTNLLKHVIDVGDAKPSKQRHYAVSPAVEKQMYAEVDRMLALGVIEESKSAWNSPVTIVAKGNGKKRLCLDARQLNSVTRKDAYPMPLIGGILARLNETRFISSIDLKDAFWQIELEESSREKTAFTVPGRPLYQFVRMPFGLCNAAQSMCRLMDMVIPSAMREYIFVYIDDLLVVSADFSTHIERLQLVADCLRRANLTINVEKSKFCMRHIKYLGHIVGNGEIKPDPERVKCISEFPQPKTVKQVRRFMGMTGWYNRYISNYSAIAAPITDMLKIRDRFVWTKEAQEAFEELKNKLITAPVLTHPDFGERFYIQCDASMTGVGGVLFQIKDGGEHPIAFMSRKLNSAQRNYSVTELECLAAILCVKQFRCYIEGMPFTIITDHASLKWLMGQKDLTGRLARWSLKLQAFDFNIEHRKGSANVVPDTLSRAHVEGLEAVVGQPIDLTDDAFSSESYTKLRVEVESHVEELPDLKVRDGIIYKRVLSIPETDDIVADTQWKVWIPEELRQKVIQEAHNPPSASHGGVDKTLNLVRRTNFWPGLTSDVRTFVANCSLCRESKAPNQTLRPLMGKPALAERPFQNMYVDLLGPYPRSKAGNTTILIVLDQLTKFVWLKPLRKATAIEIVKYVESDIFHMVGVPETLLSDNGVQFVSKEFRALLSRYGVRQINTATHAPQANASERVNRSILAAVRTYLESDQTNWDTNISSISSALRNSVHASTKHSPYFAVYGHHMVQHAGAYPILRNLQALETGDIEVIPPAELRGDINRQVRERLQQVQERSARVYNKRARDVVFQSGQEVFRRNFQQSDATRNFNAKLAKQWIPARIVRRKGASLYEIEDRQGRPIKIPYHAKDLKA